MAFKKLCDNIGTVCRSSRGIFKLYCRLVLTRKLVNIMKGNVHFGIRVGPIGIRSHENRRKCYGLIGLGSHCEGRHVTLIGRKLQRKSSICACQYKFKVGARWGFNGSQRSVYYRSGARALVLAVILHPKMKSLAKLKA